MKTFYKITLFCAMLFSVSNVVAQMTRDEGIERYRQAKYSEAISILQRLSKQKETKKDAMVWNYLGLSYLESGELKKARKALEKAVGLNPQSSAFRTNLGYALLLNRKIDSAQSESAKAIQLDPQNTGAYYVRGTARIWEGKYADALADAEKMISLDRNDSSAYTLKSNALVYIFGEKVAAGSTAKVEIEYLDQSVAALEYCLQYCKNNRSLALQKEKLEALSAFQKYFNRAKVENPSLIDAVGTGENKTRLNVLSKPQAKYTDKARRSGISGTVKLYVLFAASGKITHIIQLNSLGYGLDEQALNAARQIKFEPAQENGQPVSVVKMVHYMFTIY